MFLATLNLSFFQERSVFWPHAGSWPARWLHLRHILAAFSNSFGPNFATVMVTFQGGYFLWNWWLAARRLCVARSSISLCLSIEIPLGPLSSFRIDPFPWEVGEQKNEGERVTSACNCEWAGTGHCVLFFLCFSLPISQQYEFPKLYGPSVAPDVTSVCPCLAEGCPISAGGVSVRMDPNVQMIRGLTG